MMMERREFLMAFLAGLLFPRNVLAFNEEKSERERVYT